MVASQVQRVSPVHGHPEPDPRPRRSRGLRCPGRDHGVRSWPSPAIADVFARVPDYSQHRTDFWFDWGPIYYRGRLDGSARLLSVASDHGATERIAGRTLVGDAGQRVQGFLAKLGLTRSYLCLNPFVYGMHPSQGAGHPAGAGANGLAERAVRQVDPHHLDAAGRGGVRRQRQDSRSTCGRARATSRSSTSTTRATRTRTRCSRIGEV